MSSKFTVFVTVSLSWTLSTLLVMEAFRKMLVTYAETICSMANDSFTAQNCFLTKKKTFNALLTIYESKGLPESSLEAQDYFLVPHSYNNWITWAISWCVFWFCLISLCSWSTKPAQLSHLLNSRVKLATSSLAFSRAWNCLLVFTWSSHRLPVIFFYCSDWLLSVLWVWLSTLNRFALCSRFELSTCRLTWHFVRFYNSWTWTRHSAIWWA